MQLLRQQGRILLRLDGLEHSGTSAVSAAALGLPAGTIVDDLCLSDLTGKKTSLSDFRGRRVLLVYWNPACAFCESIAGELATLHHQLKESNTELILVSHGGSQANESMAAQYHLRCATLLLDNSSDREYVTDRLFEYCGTPSAYLLDERGRILRPLVSGSDGVLGLARQAAYSIAGDEVSADSKQKLRSLPISESRIERNGLKAGTSAPHFSLPDLDGKTVSLDQFRGRKTLLVFTDPQCGPCDALMPHMVQLHHEHVTNGLAVVMVGRGDPELNREKAREHRIAFPFVLQDRWKLSRKYGIFATPVAFLIGTDGVIMKDVAKGAQQIMELAREAGAES